MKKRFLERFSLIFFLVFLLLFICSITYAFSVSNNLSDEILRLHVIANSNSIEDQNLKYLVRDKLISYIKSENFSCKKDIVENINLNTLEEIAKNTIMDNGYNYDVSVELGNFYFPTKNYGDISFPSGNYDAIRIKIGKSEGQNWWCVLFPPLCFVNSTQFVVPEDSKDILKNNLDLESFNIISKNNESIKIKFKIIELLQNVKNSFANI